MRQRAESKGLLLVLDQPAGLPRFIRTDASKLRQILLNLLGNAIKFTSHGSVALQLRAEVAGTGTQGVLALAVRDTGPGIALEDQQRLFQPFVQLGQAGDQKGTGLGLAITRQFVELLGGRVFVESEPGKGATFRVELPFEVAQALEPADAVPNLGGLARLEPGQTQYRILIVEDQPENWLLLRRLLEHAGFLVKVSENGAAGVEDFRSWRPHLIWMDWRMPVMDGLEATRRIRALDGGREVKIAVLSASVLEQERQQVMAAGADDFVAKPFVFQQIYSCMARHLGVRFAPEEADYTQPRVASPDANLESLVDLPPEYRRRLLDALVALDQKKIAAAIETIAACNPGLGFALRHHAERLQYTCMLRALQPNLAQTLSQNSQA
jgi:CheY-like chemotaxis protein